MAYVISQFAIWMLVAFALGLLVGLGTWERKPRGNWLSSWLSWAAAVFVVGCFAAIFKLVAGRAGLWLETALAMFALYVFGCMFGSQLRALFAAPEPLLAPVADGAGRARAVGVPAHAYQAPPANAPLAVASGEAYPGKRPTGLAAPQGVPDDLTAIPGVEAVDRKILGDLGIHHFHQVAAWSPANAQWIDHHLTTPGRVENERWIASAQALAKGVSGTVAAAPKPAPDEPIKPAPATTDPATVATLAGATPFGVGSPVTAATPSAFDLHGAHPGARPSHATPGQAKSGDDIRRIRGMSPGNAVQLNRAGIYSYDQIARWGAAESAWMESFLGQPGRLARDKWIEQAQLLAAAKRIEAHAASPAHSAAAAAIAPVSAAPEITPAVLLGASSPALGSAAAAKAPASADVASAPIPAVAVAGDANAPHPGERPASLPQPRSETGDDLKWIKGVGPKNEEKLHGLGIFHFDQIAAWTPDNAKWAGSYMAFPGRIEREDWIGQCKLLAAGQLTDHAREVASGEADPSQHDDEDEHPGERPAALAAARGGKADDLELIDGIGPKNAQKLHALGIFHFDQIAAWTPDNAKWAGSSMAFPGRIEREDWIGQAKRLASGQQIASRPVAAAAAALTTAAAAAQPLRAASDLGDIDNKHPGKRPVGLAAPRDGEPDDLLKIKGVGRANLVQLHALGIFHFDQIAAWTREELRWVGSFMAYPGRLEKEDWIEQAKTLARRRAIELANRAASERGNGKGD